MQRLVKWYKFLTSRCLCPSNKPSLTGTSPELEGVSDEGVLRSSDDIFHAASRNVEAKDVCTIICSVRWKQQWRVWSPLAAFLCVRLCVLCGMFESCSPFRSIGRLLVLAAGDCSPACPIIVAWVGLTHWLCINPTSPSMYTSQCMPKFPSTKSDSFLVESCRLILSRS